MKKSPINYLTLRPKDSSRSKKFKAQRELEAIKLAYGYMLILAIMVIILAATWLQHRPHYAAKYALLLIIPTLLVVIVIIAATRVRTFFVQVVAILAVLVRGILMIYVAPRVLEGMKCQP